MRVVDIQLASGDPAGADPARGARQGCGQDHHPLVAVQWPTTRARRGAPPWSSAARSTSRRRARWPVERAHRAAHLLPNALPPLIVVGTVQVAHAIALEANAVLPRAGPADHRAVAGPADCQRLRVPAVGQVLDQRLPRRRAPGHHPVDQPGRRPAARRPQSPVGEVSLLDVTDLQTEFATRDGVLRAVQGVSFSLDRGNVLGLVGESGSGKSVTGFSILGLIDPPGRIAAAASVRRAELVGQPRSGCARCAASASR